MADAIEVPRRRSTGGRRPSTALRIDGDGTQTRDFVHVDDVVQATLRTAVTDETGRAFNVGTGESVSVRDGIDSMIDSPSTLRH